MDASANCMDYPATMPAPARPVTPHVHADPIVCDEFRRGRGYTNWRPRGSGDWLLIFTCGGVGRVRAAGVEHALGSGDAMLYRPGAEQDYFTDAEIGRWHLRWAHFQPRPHWRLRLRWPELAPGVARVSTTGRTRTGAHAALGRMLASSRLGGAGGEDLAMNALEEAILWIFLSISGDAFAAVDERVQRAVQHLAAHPDEPFHLEGLARVCGLSPSRLSHLFRAELGTTPQRFSETLRLDLAQRLLSQTNLSVAEVAAEAGYDDPLYFSRRFRRAFGRPPSAARPER
jgi:AraC family transcriptional regulator of arabinose operon